MKLFATLFLILGYSSILSAQDWQVYTSDNSLLPKSFISEIIIDYDNNTWIASDSGLVKIKNRTVTVYNSSNSILPDQSITDLYLDKQGLIWILYTDKIYTIVNENFELVNSNMGGYQIAVESNTNIFLGFNSYLLSINESNGIDTVFRPGPFNKNPLAELVIDKENSVWFRRHNDDGIRKYTIDTTIFYPTKFPEFQFSSLRDMNIDSLGNIWVCGNKSIYKYESNTDKWVDILARYSDKLDYEFSYNGVEFDSENNAYLISSRLNKLPSNLYRITDEEIETINFDTLYPNDLFAKIPSLLAVNFDKQVFIYGSETGIFEYTPNLSNVSIIPTTDYSIYPNPATSQISVDLGEGLLVSQYRILDAEGREVLSGLGELNSIQVINIQPLSVGAYSIELTTATGELVRDKFVKR